MSKTLVVSLGQLRGSSITAMSFQKNLLQALNADYAVCTTKDSHLDIENSFYRMAKYHWIAKHFDDFGMAFDIISKTEGYQQDWRKVAKIGGNWIGGAKDSGQVGMGALLFYLRWVMIRSILDAGLDKVYDHVVVTRTDFFFMCPHPEINQLGDDLIHIPNGEDYGGLTDRHMVVPMPLLVKSANFLTEFLKNPHYIADLLQSCTHRNIESYLKCHFKSQNLLQKVRRFPYIMYLVRTMDDPTSWSTGVHIPGLDHTVKYVQEYQQASFFSEIIRSQEDWVFFFQAIRSRRWSHDSWLTMFNHNEDSPIDNTRRSLALFSVGLIVDAHRNMQSNGKVSSDNTLETLYSLLQTYNAKAEKRLFGAMRDLIKN